MIIRPISSILLAVALLPPASGKTVHRGRVTWYGARRQGRTMANGKPFNRHAATVASRHLPLGARVRIRNLKNGKTAKAVVKDRGGRYLTDLSEALAVRLGFRRAGHTQASIIVIRKP